MLALAHRGNSSPRRSPALFLIPALLVGAAAFSRCGPPPVIEAKPTFAPAVPPPVNRAPARVIVKVETSEVKMRLADGVEYVFWTFGGRVPGPFIRIREGDYVEFHLSNRPDSKMPHNIDLHAVTGPGGGAAVSFTAPRRNSASRR